MKLFDRLKEWMGIRRLLRDLPQDRKPIARNLSLARKVAIVYMVEDEAAHNHVRNYVKRIKEELGIGNIMALGFSDQKVLPHYLHAKLNSIASRGVPIMAFVSANSVTVLPVAVRLNAPLPSFTSTPMPRSAQRRNVLLVTDSVCVPLPCASMAMP